MVADSRIDRSGTGKGVGARAPAKLNLALAVHGRRPDGFHAINSLVLAVELCDELEFESTERPGIELTCHPDSLPADRENLVIRAAEALAEQSDAVHGARIALTKRIPVAAGLGGGSSDAAVTLAALNRLWGLELSPADLAGLGARLGSDIPLFFSLPSAMIAGRGEAVTPKPLSWEGWVALAFGGQPVSTRDAYAQWRIEDHVAGSEERICGLCAARCAEELTPLLFNELEAAVYRAVPAVGEFHQRLRRVTGQCWRLTGAGATAFALFDHQEDARAAVAEVGKNKLAAATDVVRTAHGSMDDFLRSADRWRFPKPESS